MADENKYFKISRSIFMINILAGKFINVAYAARSIILMKSFKNIFVNRN